MTAMTIVALVGSLFAVGIGFATIVGEGGYSFDMRKKNRRTAKDGRVGGRRAEDRVSA
jgi:hypothetical protein